MVRWEAVYVVGSLLVLSTCQPAVSPEELLRAGDRIAPTITVTSHREGDPFGEASTTIAGTIVDLSRRDGTLGQLVSGSWSVEGATTGAALTFGDDGTFAFDVDTSGRAVDLVVAITATDWSENTEILRLSLEVPKEITSFSFDRLNNPRLAVDAAATITGADVRIDIPTGTVRTSLVASFAFIGSSVAVAGLAQHSGVTPNDFTYSVLYSVIGRDGGTRAYTVTVSELVGSVPPEAPSELTATALSMGSVRLAWTDNSVTETTFRIERSPDGSDWSEAGQTGAGEASWVDEGLPLWCPYRYRVKSSNASGDSGYSEVVEVTTALAEMVAINAAGDTFTMGDGSVGPNVVQAISYSFALSRSEVTHAQFSEFVLRGGYAEESLWTANGRATRQAKGWTQPVSWTNPDFDGPSQPATGISWYEAAAFCNWLSVREGLTPAYDSTGRATLTANGYRMPTEVEWEYAASKGASGESERVFPWGDTWDSGLAVWGMSPAGGLHSVDVGSTSPAGDTPQGLLDMSGNACELCSDNYEGTPVAGTDRYSFLGDQVSDTFCARGGEWELIYPAGLRCASRLYTVRADERQELYGLRLCRPVQ